MVQYNAGTRGGMILKRRAMPASAFAVVLALSRFELESYTSDSEIEQQSRQSPGKRRRVGLLTSSDMPK